MDGDGDADIVLIAPDGVYVAETSLNDVGYPENGFRVFAVNF